MNVHVASRYLVNINLICRVSLRFFPVTDESSLHSKSRWLSCIVKAG